MCNPVHSLTHDQCVQRLGSLNVGRVSVSMHALPVIVPVVYRVDSDSLVFGAPLDAELAKSCNGAVIAFEVDDLSMTSDLSWSVMVVGVATLLTGRTMNELRLPIGAGSTTVGSSGELLGIGLECLSGRERQGAVRYRPAA